MAGQPLFCAPLDLGTITSGTANAGHPATHLNRPRSVGLTWQADAATAWCRGDFGQAEDVDFCAILSANAQVATTFRLRLGDTQVEVDGTADYDSGAQTFISPSITRKDGLYHSFWKLPATQSKQWWRIDIGGHSGNFEAPFLVLGKSIVPSRFYNYDHESGVEDLGRLEWTRTGVPDYAPGLKFRTKQFTLDWVTTSEWEDEFRPLAETSGTTGIVYVCFDPESGPYRNAKTYFGRFQKPLVQRARRIPTRNGIDFEILSMIGFDGPRANAIAMVLDLTTSLDSRITFTRATTGTYFGSDGLLASAAINAARFDYNPATLAARGLLIEEARTNLLTYSEQFDNAAWGKTLASITPNVAAAPDGTTTADQISFSAGAYPQIFQAKTSLAAGDYALSIWVKSDGTPQTQHSLLFDGGVANFTPTIEWTRVALIKTGSAGGTKTPVIATNSGSAPAASFYIWGAQIEAGAYPTSYIPTVAPTVTRAVDDASFTVPGGITTLTYTFDDDSTQAVSVSAGAYTIPTTLNRPRIKTIVGS